MSTSNTTPNRGYAEPHAGNQLAADVVRLIDQIRKVDDDMATALQSLAARAPLASPNFSGAPTAPTPDGEDDSNRLATTAFVQDLINVLTGPNAIEVDSIAVAGIIKTFLASETLSGARESLGVPEATATTAALATKADADGMFYRPDHTTPVFEKTGAGTISIKAGAIIEVGRQLFTFSANTAVSMPALTAGTDYIIWIEPAGDLVANTNFSSPAVAGSRRLGGFHYAPGGNAAAFNSGGNSTPAINEHSIWDLKFRPACPDPRGMALIANSFWCDIYLLGVDHHVNGTSKFNVTIADGSSPPKLPTAFGGNGSTAYSSLTWFEAAEVIQSHGKHLLSYDEFAAAMYGTKEAQAGGTDPVSTILRADYTSRWGIMLATGNMWVWGRNFGGNFGATSYTANTGGRGSTHTLSNVAILGGHWDNGANAGSRASYWVDLPSNSSNSLGARGRSDHLSHV